MGGVQADMEQLRIAMVAPYEYPYAGGVAEHIRHLSETLRKKGHEVHIVAPCPEDVELPEHVIAATKHIVSFPFAGSQARISLSPRVYTRAKDILAQHRFDIVHLQEPLTPTLPWAMLYHSSAVNVGTFHAYRENSFTYAAWRVILESFMERLQGRIAVSEAARDYVASYFPGDYRVIPNGIDVEAFSEPDVEPLERFNDGKPNILFLGRLEKRKGFRHLLKAFEILKARVPDARLIVAGAFDKDSKEPFVRYVREHGIHDVRFVGYVPPRALPRYYRMCTVYCAPSTGSESFGIVLLEAMASGRPVVATDIPGYRSVLQNGVQGLLVPPEDEGALAVALERILRNADMGRAMGEAGLRRAGEFSWDSVTDKVLEFYSELLDQHRRIGGKANIHD
jgi:phosphatidylinositol alpha-mannosyltransferase